MANDQPQTTSVRGLRLANIFAVAGTGVRSGGHLFRRPRNLSIKRSLMAVFNGLRGISVPPNSRDHVPVKADRDRSWKRHRRTRWKERP